MKVLFLDIDGVLNTAESRGKFGLEDISPQRIERVNQIVARTGCEVVLSSTWRYLFKWDYLQQRFKDAGATFQLYDKTPQHHRPDEGRGTEIQEWLSLQQGAGVPIESFVIIDDDIFDITNVLPHDCIIQTSDDGRILIIDEELNIHDQHIVEPGLTNTHVEHAVKILGESNARQIRT